MKGHIMTKKFTLASIMTALTLVCLFGSAYIPTGKIALLALTSMCMLVTVSECGVRYAWIQYAATSLLALLLIPAKGQVMLFIGLIGYYPILKLHIESIGKVWIEWFVKIMYFNALLIVVFFLLKYVILNYINLSTIMDFVLANLAIVVTISEIVFIIYDYLLGFFARYYRLVISKRIR